jgi:hypothetical protein
MSVLLSEIPALVVNLVVNAARITTFPLRHAARDCAEPPVCDRCAKAKQARAWKEIEKDALEKIGQPKDGGPEQTCVVQAMRLFAEAESKFKKGAKQELTRINKWHQAAGESRLHLVTRDDGTTSIVDVVGTSVLPRTLAEHRATRAVKSAQADVLRAQLACMPRGKNYRPPSHRFSERAARRRPVARHDSPGNGAAQANIPGPPGRLELER